MACKINATNAFMEVPKFSYYDNGATCLFQLFMKSVVSDRCTVASDRFYSKYHDINSMFDPESYMSSKYNRNSSAESVNQVWNSANRIRDSLYSKTNKIFY